MQIININCARFTVLYTLKYSPYCSPSNAGLRRLNLTFQASHTFLLLLVGKSSDYAFATSRPTTSFNSAHLELSILYKNVSDTLQRSQSTATNCQQKALLSSSLLQPVSITRGKNAVGFSDLYATCTANICYRHVPTIVYHICILHHCTDL